MHSESTSASSAAAGAATIVLGFTISVPQELKARGRRSALVSDASCKGNARRWTLEGCRRDSKRHANAGGAQTRLSNVGQLAAQEGTFPFPLPLQSRHSRAHARGRTWWGCDALRDHLIRPTQQRRRHREAECLCGLEVDHQLKVRRPLHRQVGRAGTLDDLGDVNGNSLH